MRRQHLLLPHQDFPLLLLLLQLPSSATQIISLEAGTDQVTDMQTEKEKQELWKQIPTIHTVVSFKKKDDSSPFYIMKRLSEYKFVKQAKTLAIMRRGNVCLDLCVFVARDTFLPLPRRRSQQGWERERCQKAKRPKELPTDKEQEKVDPSLDKSPSAARNAWREEYFRYFSIW